MGTCGGEDEKNTDNERRHGSRHRYATYVGKDIFVLRLS